MSLPPDGCGPISDRPVGSPSSGISFSASKAGWSSIDYADVECSYPDSRDDMEILGLTRADLRLLDEVRAAVGRRQRPSPWALTSYFLITPSNLITTHNRASRWSRAADGDGLGHHLATAAGKPACRPSRFSAHRRTPPEWPPANGQHGIRELREECRRRSNSSPSRTKRESMASEV